RQRIDDQAAQIDVLKAELIALSAGGRLSERMIALERRLGGLPTRVDRLELPTCSSFQFDGRTKSKRQKPRPPLDDTPASVLSVNAAQWRTLAQVARNLAKPTCIRDLRTDQEPDGLGQLEVIVAVDTRNTLEIDLYRDGSIAEAELLISFATLPAALRRTIRLEDCAPRKTELSIRSPVSASDIRRLLEWWRPSPSGDHPSLTEQIVVEIDCGTKLWDLELSADGTVVKDGRSEY
ncbi:MAG: hypothetical protein AAFV29_25995, partial [Myxococcota bacterium]